MERPRIVAKVIGSLKQKQWIDIFANDWCIGSIWGKAKVQYIGDDPNLLMTYRIYNDDIFLYVDAIVRRVEAVEPIKPIEPELVKL